MTDAVPTLAQLITHPLQAECLIHYMREERGEGVIAEALVELHNTRQLAHDDLRREGFRMIWKRFIISQQIPLSIPLEEEVKAKAEAVEANPLGFQDIFYKFEQEVIPRLQSVFQTFLESPLWGNYQKATDPEGYRRLRLQTELNNFPPLPFPSRDPLQVARYTLMNALDLVRTVKANLLSDGKKKRVDTKFCIQTKAYNFMCQGASELRKISLSSLDSSERLVFFLNLYNIMVIHAHLAFDSCPTEKDDSVQKVKYNVANFVFSLDDIRTGIFGAKGPKKLFPQSDPRSQLNIDFDPRLPLCVTPTNRSLPCTRVYTVEHLEEDINSAVVKFLSVSSSICDNSIVLPKLFKDLKKDMGGSEGILNFVGKFLTEEQQSKLASKGKVKISYSNGYESADLCWIEYEPEDMKDRPLKKSGRTLFPFSSPKEKRGQSPPSKKSKKTGATSPKLGKASESSTTPANTTTAATPATPPVSLTGPPLQPEVIDIVELEARLKSKFPSEVLELSLRAGVGQEVIRINGPKDQSNGEELHYGTYISAKVISTYPHVPTKPLRDGDPICDRIGILGFENRCIVTMTDGCNWGAKARDASLRANETFIKVVEENIQSLENLDQVASVFLKAVMLAHEAIMNTKASEIGTTTILGGLLCELEPEGEKRRWGFFCISVGDCKAYHYSVKRQAVVDITKGNRKNLIDARDPGGRLGPYNDGSLPDLRNLALYFRCVEEGDLVVIVSDGVHDNFDPQLMGVNPREMGIDADSWATATPDQIEEKKYQFSSHMMSKLLSRLPVRHGTVSARKAADHLIDHANTMTSASRDFMVNFPKKKLPIDYKTYPGKMDHTSCMCLRVGQLPLTTDDGDDTPPDSSRTSSEKYELLSPSFIKMLSSGKFTPPSQEGSYPMNYNLKRSSSNLSTGSAGSATGELPSVQLLPELANGGKR